VKVPKIIDFVSFGTRSLCDALLTIVQKPLKDEMDYLIEVCLRLCITAVLAMAESPSS